MLRVSRHTLCLHLQYAVLLDVSLLTTCDDLIIRAHVWTYGSFSKLWTSEMSRTLQPSTVCFGRVSYLLECNAYDTYVLRMTHMGVSKKSVLGK